MLPIIWLDEAITDLTDIITFISEENPRSALRLKTRLEAAPLSLAEHPYMCPVGLVPGTRELVAHPTYVVVYRVTSQRIEVINIIHTSQQYPKT